MQKNVNKPDCRESLWRLKDERKKYEIKAKKAEWNVVIFSLFVVIFLLITPIAGMITIILGIIIKPYVAINVAKILLLLTMGSMLYVRYQFFKFIEINNSLQNISKKIKECEKSLI